MTRWIYLRKNILINSWLSGLIGSRTCSFHDRYNYVHLPQRATDLSESGYLMMILSWQLFVGIFSLMTQLIGLNQSGICRPANDNPPCCWELRYFQHTESSTASELSYRRYDGHGWKVTRLAQQILTACRPSWTCGSAHVRALTWFVPTLNSEKLAGLCGVVLFKVIVRILLTQSSLWICRQCALKIQQPRYQRVCLWVDWPKDLRHWLYRFAGIFTGSS